MKFAELEISMEVASELSLVSLFVEDNLQFHKNNHTFSELIEELNASIVKYKKEEHEKVKNCYIIGHCLIDPTAKILPGTTVIGPCIIGPNCEVGPNAYIRQGTVLGPNARVGFGAEVKESIIGSNTIITHFSYIGNSLIGNDCEIGASAVLSAKRLDLLEVRLWVGGDQYMTTNCQKLGAVIGDNVKIGSGTIVMPGTYIGSNSIVWPNIVVAKYILENSIIKTERGLSREQNNPEPNNNQLELLKLSIESYHRENDRFWSRNTVFAAISAALLTIFAAYGTKFSPFSAFLLSLFGLGTAYAWFQTVRMSKYYFQRDELDAKAFVESRENYSTILARWTKSPRGKRPSGRRPTACIKIVSFLTIFLWLGVILISILSLIFNIKLL